MRKTEQMTMVEKIGLVLAQRKYGDVGWDDMPEHARDDFLDAARAALSALREPTDAMWDAGHAALEIHGDSARASCWAFVAMIDAALAESEK